jgi:hypothetical protein
LPIGPRVTITRHPPIACRLRIGRAVRIGHGIGSAMWGSRAATAVASTAMAGR